MRTLRAKLFVSFGAILLAVVLVNYLVFDILARRDIDRASSYISDYFDKVQKKMLSVSSFLISYRLIDAAAELTGISEMISSIISKPTDWQTAARIYAVSPEIAFVQIHDKLLTPREAKLYTPSYAPLADNLLWVKIPGRDELYIATFHDPYYLVYPASEIKNTEAPPTSWIPLQEKTSLFTVDASALELYEYLLQESNSWVEKAKLIAALTPLVEMTHAPTGILKIDMAKQSGALLLTQEAFQMQPLSIAPQPHPFLITRQTPNGPDLDLVSSLSQGSVAFSALDMGKQIAQMIQRSVIFYKDGSFALMVSEQGEVHDLLRADFPLSSLKSPTLIWNKVSYSLRSIDLSELTLVILTPTTQAEEIVRFMADLKTKLLEKISINLFGAASLCLAISLLLLGRTSKSITQPIALLAEAASEIGKGKYENLHLPAIDKRKDEVATLTHSFEKMTIALADREKVRAVLNKVVSKEVASEILKGSIELGGEVRKATFFFSDIRGFTSLSEHLPPQEVISLLNTYMTRMCRFIDATGGVVDKFVGDEIMALYGAPLALQDHAAKAAEAALLMMQELKQLNDEKRRANKPTFEIGIGIHSGIACCGNVGAENRLNYTAIGSNVNLASRLCAAARPGEILISESTYQLIKDRFPCKKQEPITLKGFDEPLTTYTIRLA